MSEKFDTSDLRLRHSAAKGAKIAQALPGEMNARIEYARRLPIGRNPDTTCYALLKLERKDSGAVAAQQLAAKTAL